MGSSFNTDKIEYSNVFFWGGGGKLCQFPLCVNADPDWNRVLEKPPAAIWARQNLPLLTSSWSGRRALVQILEDVLIFRHVDLKNLKAQAALLLWAASLPYCTGWLYWQDLSKLPRVSKIHAAAQIFTISCENSKILSRRLSVQSLPRKFIHDHCCCPNSATILTVS